MSRGLPNYHGVCFFFPHPEVEFSKANALQGLISNVEEFKHRPAQCRTEGAQTKPPRLTCQHMCVDKIYVYADNFMSSDLPRRYRIDPLVELGVE